MVHVLSTLVTDIVLTILAFVFPPLVAFIKRQCGLQFWLNIVLTILGWVPGIIHAIILVWLHPWVNMKVK